MFVLKLNPKVCFGQIWSRKLQFSKLTKICYRGSLLYPFFEFNIEFSHSYFFLASFVQNLKFSKLTEIRYRGTLLYAYYDFNIYFPKILLKKFFGNVLGKLAPKSEILQIDWNFVQGYIAIYLLQFKCLLFQMLFNFKLLFIILLQTNVYCCHSYNFGQIWS